VNSRSGKVVHEVVPDGSVYYGANSDPGNTDETVKFPSAVALVWRWTGDNRFRDDMYDFTVRNLKYAFANLDADHDGWLEGPGNVERQGMGQEKLDNTVYAIRGLLDLADMAASKNDPATRHWATTKAQGLQTRFETAWWYGNGTSSYADSLCDPNNVQLFQKYCIGLTPVEAELPAHGGIAAGPLAALDHATSTVAAHESSVFTGTNGLFHNGTGLVLRDLRSRRCAADRRSDHLHLGHLDRRGCRSGGRSHRVDPARPVHQRPGAGAAQPRRVGGAGRNA
jgi:hypothetical protein